MVTSIEIKNVYARRHKFRDALPQLVLIGDRTTFQILTYNYLKYFLKNRIATQSGDRKPPPPENNK